MKKTEKNLYLLYMLFGVALITSNCIASKLMILPFQMFGSAVTITCGVIVYPITFLVTDILGEIWGKKEAGLAVKFGFICQVIATAIIVIARYIPAADATMQEAYVNLLGQNTMFVIASLSAYLCSQKWDVFIFHKIRDAYIKKHGSTKGGKWIWNNVGTMTSQLLDSSIYVLVAFGLGFKWLWTPGMVTMMLNMIIAQWLFKVVIAALDTPFFYWFTREGKR
jgi:uncharacterized integral membrane protein (TIGR00697 family)|nr:MAG TPA: Putative vitamin uptake transporter [Caudoviricetes sp.]